MTDPGAGRLVEPVVDPTGAAAAALVPTSSGDGGVPPSGLVGIVGVSAVSIGLGAAAVNVIAYLTPAIQSDAGVGRGLVGAVSSVFFGVTGLGAFVAGRLVSRVGTRLSVAGGLACLTACCALVSVTGVFATLFVYAAVGGAAYAMTTVATNVAVAAVVPPRRRALGLTAKTAGGPLISSGFALLAGLSVGTLGWRGVIALLGGIAGVALVAVTVVLRRADIHPGATRAGPRRHLPPVVYVVAVAGFLIGAGAQPLFSWLLPYLVDELRLDEGVAGVVTAASTATGVVGMLVVATLSDRIGPRQRLVVLSGAGATGAVAVVTLSLASADQMPLVLVAAMTGIVAYTSSIGVLHAATVDLAPHAVDQASGVVLMGFYLGAWFSPFAFGLVADAWGFDAAWFAAASALVLSMVTFGCAVAAGRRALTSVDGPRPEPARSG